MKKTITEHITLATSNLANGSDEAVWRLVVKTIEWLLITREFVDGPFLDRRKNVPGLKLKEKRKNTFYAEFDAAFGEMKKLLNRRDLRAIFVMTGASVVNPRETWILNLPPKKFGITDCSIIKPNLTCLSQLMMSDFFEAKRSSGHLHILLGIDVQLDALLDEMRLDDDKADSESLFERHNAHSGMDDIRGNVLKIDYGEDVINHSSSNLQYYRLVRPLKGFCH